MELSSSHFVRIEGTKVHVATGGTEESRLAFAELMAKREEVVAERARIDKQLKESATSDTRVALLNEWSELGNFIKTFDGIAVKVCDAFRSAGIDPPPGCVNYPAQPLANNQAKTTPATAVVEGSLPYGGHLSEAYWLVLRELQAPGGIPESIFSEAWPRYLEKWNDQRKGGAVLHSALKPFDWVWPRWESANEIQRGHNAPTIAETRQEFTVDDEQVYSHLTGESLRAAWMERADWTRELMARELIGRIMTVANINSHYEQLANPPFQKLVPFLQFNRPAYDGDGFPETCKQFHGVRLHHAKALQVFPRLPCESLRCVCWINAEKKAS